MPVQSTKGYQKFELSGEVIAVCIDVQRQLGVHCMEVDYQRALELALTKRGLEWEREVHVPICYDGVVVTRRRVDFVIRKGDEELIMETKAASTVLPEDIEQCLLYLNQGHYRLCLLINFGQNPIFIQRLVNSPKEQDK